MNYLATGERLHFQCACGRGTLFHSSDPNYARFWVRCLLGLEVPSGTASGYVSGKLPVKILGLSLVLLNPRFFVSMGLPMWQQVKSAELASERD